MKKKIFLLLILVLSLVMVPVGAKSKDNFAVDDNLKLDKSIGATTFAAGNTVNVNSEIDGAAFIAGNNVSISSSQDFLFTAGNSITLSGVNAKDAFVAGSNINIQSSNIRDLYAAAETIRIDSNISRNAYLGGTNVTINSIINGDVEVSAENIVIGKEAEITGTLNYPENAKITIEETAKVAQKTTYKVDTSTSEKTFRSKLLDRLYAFISMLLIGIILMALNKKAFAKIAKIKKDVSTFAKNVGIGFVFLVVIPIAAIILLFTVVGVPISIISLLLYGIMIYLSVIPTAYYLGNAFLKDKIKNEFGLFVVSLLTIYILRMIPGIGGLVTFISLCFGLGVYFELIKSNINSK